MQAATDHKCRRRTCLLVGIVLGTLLTLSLSYGVKWAWGRYTGTPRAVWLRWGWAEKANEQTADEAAACWAELEQRLGPELEQCVSDPRWESLPDYRSVLSSKYFKERDYGKSFEMHAAVLATSGRKPPFETVYLAGLAGKKEWLAGLLGSEPNPLGMTFDRFVRANLAWIAGDDNEVLKMTTPLAWPEGYTAPRGQALESWLALMRGKALARLQRCGEAFDVLSKQWRPRWWEAQRSKNIEAMVSEEFHNHAVMIFARVAEEAGRLEEALVLARDLRGQLESAGGRSYRDGRFEVDEMIGRLKFRLGAKRDN